MSAQGIWLADEAGALRRPKSKKEIREIAADSPERIHFEETSVFATSEGPFNATQIPVFGSVTFVGPDPHTKRTFFGQISNVGFDGAPRLVVK